MLSIYRKGFNIHIQRIFCTKISKPSISIPTKYNIKHDSYNRYIELLEAENMIKNHKLIYYPPNSHKENPNKIYDIEFDTKYTKSTTNYSINDSIYNYGKMIE